MTISLDNIEEFKIPLENYSAIGIFKDENGNLAGKEHQDQISPLNPNAAKFLWDYEMKLGIKSTEKYYKNVSKFKTEFIDQEKIKKYLYNLGIPFDQKVFIVTQPEIAVVLTWKMLIKYAHNLFYAYDQTVWDKSLNWKLTFDDKGEFTFGKDLIYDGQLELMKNREKLESTLKEMEERKKGKSFE